MEDRPAAVHSAGSHHHPGDGSAARVEKPEHPALENDTRPWGGYQVLEDAHTHKVKRIEVLPGARLSLQRHRHRSEHWFVIAGTGAATRDKDIIPLKAGDSLDVPAGAAHRISNPGEDMLVLIEVQHGSYFGEDDIERLEDDYGRE